MRKRKRVRRSFTPAAVTVVGTPGGSGRVPARPVDNEALLGVATTVLERSVSGGANRDDD
jgi:hypothetical protein